MISILDRFFRLKEQKTDVKTEFVAGATTFLTMMYIVPLNGIIMSHAGMPVEAVITATAVVTVIVTIINGIWSNTPIAFSVGLGVNSYFAYTLVLGEKLPWQTVLGIVFLSGIFFVIITVTRLRGWIVASISHDFKIAISAGIGVFIAFIGLKEMGIIVHHKATLLSFGNLYDSNVLLGIAGIFIIVALLAWKVKGAFIIGILITSVLGFVTGGSAWPSSVVSMPASMEPVFFKLDILSALKLSLLPAVVTFFLTALFDGIGSLSGVGYRAGLFAEKDSRPIQRTLEVDSAASVIGSLFGLSTVLCFIESAAGVEEGGRTGLTAVFTGIFFIATLFFLPFFRSIPPNAVYPVLVIVGVMMFSELKHIDFGSFESALPVFFIVILMPLTFSITKGLAAGFISYIFVKIASGKFRDISTVTACLAAVSILAFIVG